MLQHRREERRIGVDKKRGRRTGPCLWREGRQASAKEPTYAAPCNAELRGRLAMPDRAHARQPQSSGGTLWLTHPTALVLFPNPNVGTTPGTQERAWLCAHGTPYPSLARSEKPFCHCHGTNTSDTRNISVGESAATLLSTSITFPPKLRSETCESYKDLIVGSTTLFGTPLPFV